MQLQNTSKRETSYKDWKLRGAQQLNETFANTKTFPDQKKYTKTFNQNTYRFTS